MSRYDPLSPRGRRSHSFDGSVPGIQYTRWQPGLENSLGPTRRPLPHGDPAYDPNPGPMTDSGPHYHDPYRGSTSYHLPQTPDTPALPPVTPEDPWPFLGELRDVMGDVFALGKMLQRDPEMGDHPDLWPPAEDLLDFHRQATEQLARMDVEGMDAAEIRAQLHAALDLGAMPETEPPVAPMDDPLMPVFGTVEPPVEPSDPLVPPMAVDPIPASPAANSLEQVVQQEFEPLQDAEEDLIRQQNALFNPAMGFFPDPFAPPGP